MHISKSHLSQPKLPTLGSIFAAQTSQVNVADEPPRLRSAVGGRWHIAWRASHRTGGGFAPLEGVRAAASFAALRFRPAAPAGATAKAAPAAPAAVLVALALGAAALGGARGGAPAASRILSPACCNCGARMGRARISGRGGNCPRHGTLCRASGQSVPECPQRTPFIVSPSSNLTSTLPSSCTFFTRPAMGFGLPSTCHASHGPRLSGSIQVAAVAAKPGQSQPPADGACEGYGWLAAHIEDAGDARAARQSGRLLLLGTAAATHGLAIAR